MIPPIIAAAATTPITTGTTGKLLSEAGAGVEVAGAVVVGALVVGAGVGALVAVVAGGVVLAPGVGVGSSGTAFPSTIFRP